MLKPGLPNTGEKLPSEGQLNGMQKAIDTIEKMLSQIEPALTHDALDMRSTDLAIKVILLRGFDKTILPVLNEFGDEHPLSRVIRNYIIHEISLSAPLSNEATNENIRSLFVERMSKKVTEQMQNDLEKRKNFDEVIRNELIEMLENLKKKLKSSLNIGEG